MFDVIICLICPLPFCEYKFYFVEYVPSEKNHLEAEYLVSDIILILMFSRIYLVIRNALNHTEFTDPYAKLHCERHGFTANARFCFRCFMAKYPGITVVTILSLSVFILSYILRITERSFLNKYMEWKSYNPINNIYLIIVTMTTVGFGDYVPYTTLGKLVTMITALWGAFIISLLIVSVNAIFTLSPKQKVAYDKLIRVRTAAKCIISAMRYHVINTKLKYAQNIRVTRSSRSSIYISDAIVSKYWKIFEKNIKKFKEISKSVKISGERSAVTSKASTNDITVDTEGLDISRDSPRSDLSIANNSPSRIAESQCLSPIERPTQESIPLGVITSKERRTANFQASVDEFIMSGHSDGELFMPIEEEKDVDNSINSDIKIKKSHNSRKDK